MELEIVFKDGRTSDVAHTPTEGKIFEVNPLEIDRSKFEKPMRDQKQEWRRQTIQEAFAEVDKNPEKYEHEDLINETNRKYANKWDKYSRFFKSLSHQYGMVNMLLCFVYKYPSHAKDEDKKEN